MSQSFFSRETFTASRSEVCQVLAEALGLVTDGPVFPLHNNKPTIIKDQRSGGLKESRGEREVLRESERPQIAVVGNATFRSEVLNLQGPRL